MSEDFGIKNKILSLGNLLIHVWRHRWRRMLIRLYR